MAGESKAGLTGGTVEKRFTGCRKEKDLHHKSAGIPKERGRISLFEIIFDMNAPFYAGTPSEEPFVVRTKFLTQYNT